jgi:amino acid adenylation domain-containing protein
MDRAGSDARVHQGPGEALAPRRATRLAVPPKKIPPGCQVITPQMVSLVNLDPQQIEQIVRTVPGGAANIEDIYPLAPLQEGILFHHTLGKLGDGYLLPTLLEFQSRARLEAFIDALQEVIGRHDVLRSAVLWEHVPEPLQVVYRYARLPVEEISLDRDRDALAQVKEWLERERQRIDLTLAPLMRLKMAADPHGDRWYVLLQHHHVISDHDALATLCAEVTAFLEGRGQQLPDPVPYRNHVAQTRARAAIHDAKVFFKRKLADITEPTAPFGLMDVHGDGSEIDEASESLDAVLALRVRACARHRRVNVAAVFHAAWGLVIACTSGRYDVVFGTVLLGRLHSGGGEKGQMGMFLNTLPLRLRLEHVSVAELVEQAHQELLQLLSCEQSSLAEAQRCSGITGSAPLFTALLNYRHTLRKWAWASVPGVRELAVQDRSNYPITLSVDDFGDGFTFVAQTDRRIDPRRMTAYLRTATLSLVEALERSPGTSALGMSVLPESERRQVVDSFNATQAAYPQGKLIHELFEDQVERTPDAVAVVFEGESLTYAELNRRANQLACYLRDRGIGPEERVGVCLERGLEMVVGLLGVLKAGGAYVPLDPSYPAERLQYMLGDAAPRVLLTQAGLIEGLPPTDAEVIVLDEHWSEIAQQPSSDLDALAFGLGSHHLAYVIYTSGSTGQPKGVMVEHRNVTRLFAATEKWFGFNEHDVWTMFHSFAFDFSVWELWGALLYGGRVVVVPHLTARSAHEFYQLICAEGVTVLNQTPSAFAQLIGAQEYALDKQHSLRVVIFGGEALELHTLRPWVKRNGATQPRLVNMYGITETTVHVTYRPLTEQEIGSERSSVVGRPIDDLRAYLLDAHQQPVPIGVVGEIYIGGAGLARGYLNRPQLTAEKFIKDPFNTDPQARLYKTGDLGRWRADGNIDYLGRNDHQVKIRGFRIELGEIEAQVLRHPQVKEAIVLAREDEPGNKRLVAYVVCREPSDTGGVLSVETLRAHLKPTLPDYMLPSAFVMLESLPLTANGKLDRRALPAPSLDAHATREYEPPQGAIEEGLATLWCEMLGVDRVGRHDDFFELGGHSLLGMKLIVKVAERFKVRPPVVTIFQYPTLRQMGQLVGKLLTDHSKAMDLSPSAAALEQPRIVPRVPCDRVPLTFSQRWLWNALKLDQCPSTRAVAAAVRLKGRVHIGHLRQSFADLLRRHEALRTRIVLVEGIPQQEIDPYVEYDLPIVCLTSLCESDRVAEAKRLAEEIVHEPISLAVGPLFCARLLTLTDDDHVLVIAMDHMISDAVSRSIVFRDLWAIYRQLARGLGSSILPLAVQFADYALWQHETLHSWMEQHGAYWNRRLHGSRRLCVPAGDLGVGATRAKLGRLPVSFGESLSAQLRDLSRRERTTLVMSVLTVYVALLSRVCKETDLVVAFIAMARLHPEVENTVGYFNAPLFLRMTLSDEDSFVSLLRRVTEEYGTAYRHSDCGKLAAQIPEPEFVWNPRFNWIPGEFAPVATGGAALEPRDFELAPREDSEWGGELELAVSDTREGVRGTLSYRADRLTGSTMERFRRDLVLLVEELVAHPNASLPILCRSANAGCGECSFDS